MIKTRWLDKNLMAAFIASAAGAQIFLLLPVIAGWIFEHFGIDESNVGLLLSVYFSGFLLTSILSFALSKKTARTGPGTNTLLWGYCILVPGLCGCGLSESTTWLAGSLAICGVGSGLLYGTGISVVSKLEETERGFGAMIAIQQILALVLIYCLPVWVYSPLGYTASWLVLAAVVSTMGLSSRWHHKLGGHKPGYRVIADHAGTPTNTIFVTLICLLIHFALLSAVWTFIERLGIKQGFSTEKIALALSLSLLGGIVGALGSAAAGNRLGGRFPHVASTLALIAIFYGLAYSQQWIGYLTSVITFSAVWSYCLTYQMASIGNLNDRFSILIPGVQGMAAMSGPVLGGWLISISGYEGLMINAAILVFISGAGFTRLAPMTANP